MKRASEDEMAGWHHQCNEHELGQTPGDGERQGGLASCSQYLVSVEHDWATEQQQHTLFKNNLFTPNFTTSYVLICFLIGRKLLYNVVGFCHTTMCCCCCCSKSLQLCLTLCDTIDGSPPGSPVPGILQARTLEWVAISFSNA